MAKQLDTELYSIPQEMKKAVRHYKADKIGRIWKYLFSEGNWNK